MSGPLIIGRYVLFDPIASGGMAAIHFGRVLGAAGFSRLVAIKRILPHVRTNEDFVAMFMDEARLVARIRHPNVVPTLDVLAHEGEILQIMEYVHGETLAALARRAADIGESVPIDIAVHAVAGALRGLHAAHDATSARGTALGIVHRDVSPQNVLVGTDGVARVLDFGVAKAAGRIHVTPVGSVKGKARYMAPEQVQSEALDRRVDVYAAGVVLWELLSGNKLFGDRELKDVLGAIVSDRTIPPPSTRRPEVPRVLDAIVSRAIDRDRDRRFATAAEMADALEAAIPAPKAATVGAWVARVGGDALAARARTMADVEAQSGLVEVTTSARSLPSTPSDAGEIDVALTSPTLETKTETGLSSRKTLPVVMPRRRRSVLWLALVAIPVIGFGAWYATRSRFVTPKVAERVTSPIASPTMSSSTLGQEFPPVVSVASATARPAPSVRAAASSTSVRHAPTAAPSIRVKDPCDPPFTVDDAGVKVPKRECLR